MLRNDPVVSDLARHMRQLDASTALLDWEAARKSELESQYCADGDFYDALGRVECEATANRLFLMLKVGNFDVARGGACAIMLDAAKDYAACTLKIELEEMANSEPDLH